ncbi:helix-turn-helix domain-containing protein [Streptomyces microflavus]|uniref:helix-turn-helix domain-containing protein n=1 Tax=Streptomyces microflavus TaxID=1919 RepID=UPI0036CAD608
MVSCPPSRWALSRRVPGGVRASGFPGAAVERWSLSHAASRLLSELFDRIDALVASRSLLPPPAAERKRLRAAHGLTLDEVAAAQDVRRATVSGWESGRTEPRPPEREGYARLLGKLVELYPADPNATAPVEGSAVPAMFSSSPDTVPRVQPVPAGAVPGAATVTTEQSIRTRPAADAVSPVPPVSPAAVSPPAPITRTTTASASLSRRAGARKAAGSGTPGTGEAGTPGSGTDPRFAHGPLAVLMPDRPAVAAGGSRLRKAGPS